MNWFALVGEMCYLLIHCLNKIFIKKWREICYGNQKLLNLKKKKQMAKRKTVSFHLWIDGLWDTKSLHRVHLNEENHKMPLRHFSVEFSYNCDDIITTESFGGQYTRDLPTIRKVISRIIQVNRFGQFIHLNFCNIDFKK